MTALGISKGDKADIQYFFNEYYRIMLNGKKLMLKYQSSEIFIANNVLGLKFSIDDPGFKKGDEFVIENRLFFSEFGFQIRLPARIQVNT